MHTTNLFKDGAESASHASATASASTSAAKPNGAPTARLPETFRALVDLVDSSGKRLLAQQLHDQVGVVRFAPPQLTLKPRQPLGADWSRDLAAALKAATGITWQIGLSDEPSEPSLLEQEKIAEERVRADVLADPAVAAVLEAFPEATLESFSATKGA